VRSSASRMMNAATFGQLIILIVYIPVLTLGGIEGKMFRPMAQTVVYALLGAILLSLTYVPMMSALMLKRRTGPTHNFSDKLLGVLERTYSPVLASALNNRLKVVATALVLFVAAYLGFQRMGGEF